jgi:GNAT superfamily N-acetyltransferase
MNLPSEALEAALPLDPHPPGARRWVPIRTLAEHHRERVLTHLLKLDERDRLLRFGHWASDEQIARYVASLDFERDEVFGVFDRRLRLVAMAHLARAQASQDGDRETEHVAEFGVSVLPRQRGRGIGTRLFEHAMMHARNRGVRWMVIHVARENSPMLAIVRRAGAKVQIDGTEAVAELALPDDTIGSQLEELLGHHAADLDYRLKRQVLRLDCATG